MTMTLAEIKEHLLRLYDIDDLVEGLRLTSEELLDRFEDKLLMNLHKFQEEFEDEARLFQGQEEDQINEY